MSEDIKKELMCSNDTHCSASSVEVDVKQDPDYFDDKPNKLNIKSPIYCSGICRCCLAQGEFQTMENKNDCSESYCEMLNETFNLSLTSKHMRIICPICLAFLTQAYQFRQRVLASEKILNEKEIQIEIKLEPLDSKNVLILPNNSSELDNKHESAEKCRVKVDPEFKIEIESDFNDDMQFDSEKSESPRKKRTKQIKAKNYKCDICSTRLRTEKQKGKHTTNKHLTCHVCKKVFEAMTERDNHLKSHPVECGLCDDKFENSKMRSKHILAKHGMMCKICNVHVPVQKKYKHNVEFHGAEPHKCGICDKNFYIKFKLLGHQRKVHMKERNAPCSHCDFVAFDANSLRKHMLTHTTEKKHQCEYCNKRFVRKDTLNFHLRIHTGDKRKICKFCGEAFVQRASLKYHLEKYHPGDFY